MDGFEKVEFGKIEQWTNLGKLKKNDLGNFISKKLTQKIPQGNTT
jgi:hypothetical protein